MRARSPNRLTRGLTLCLAAALAVGCGDRPSRDALETDTALARDLTLVGSGSLDQPPALQDVPEPPATRRAPAPPPSPRRATSSPRSVEPPRAASADSTRVAAAPSAPSPVAPRQAAPAPVPPPASDSAGRAPHQPGALAAGTVLTLRPHIRICTNTNSVGDLFEATIAEPVIGSDGATVPAGANAVLRVTAFTPSLGGGSGVLTFAVLAVGISQRSYSVSVTDAGSAADAAPSVTAQPTAMSQQFADFGHCVPRDGEMRLTLTRPLRLTAR